MRFATLPSLLLAVGACHGDESTVDPVASCDTPNRWVAERCLEPGVGDDGCPAGTLAREGGCQPAGMTPEMCADGFVHDGDVGCEPILPSEPCLPGWIAVPGDTACRKVMECGSGTWGDLPIDETTEHVDARYSGGNSDGSAARPWTSIADAYDAAMLGALIAVAEGSYEAVAISKSVRLWGVCPERVEVRGMQSAFSAIAITAADSVEVGGVTARGVGSGIGVLISTNVSIDRVWVHETAWRGIAFDNSTGRIVRSLVEQSGEWGVFVAANALTDIEASVVRGGQLDPSGVKGLGVQVQPFCQNGACTDDSATVAIRQSVIEDNRHAGINVLASHLTLEGAVVRRTLPDTDGFLGNGVYLIACPAGTCPNPVRSSAVVQSSLIEGNHASGIFIQGSDATVDATVVRGTLPQAADQLHGRGIDFYTCDPLDDPACNPPIPANLALRGSLIEDNHELGLYIAGAEAIVESTVLRDPLPRATDQTRGRNIQLQTPCVENFECNLLAPGRLTVRGSVIERGRDMSIMVFSSFLTLESTFVRDTLGRASTGLFGDGVSVLSNSQATAGAVIAGSHISQSHRAGIAGFGASVSLSATAIDCASIDLAAEPHDSLDAPFEDRGGNACGCPTATNTCKALSSGLEPPSEL